MGARQGSTIFVNHLAILRERLKTQIEATNSAPRDSKRWCSSAAELGSFSISDAKTLSVVLLHAACLGGTAEKQDMNLLAYQNGMNLFTYHSPRFTSFKRSWFKSSMESWPFTPWSHSGLAPRKMVSRPTNVSHWDQQIAGKIDGKFTSTLPQKKTWAFNQTPPKTGWAPRNSGLIQGLLTTNNR